MPAREKQTSSEKLWHEIACLYFEHSVTLMGLEFESYQ